eukprot:13281780-Alexandrium_andersonii.AAC.1
MEARLAEVVEVDLEADGEDLLLATLARSLRELLAGEQEGRQAVEVQVRGVELGAHRNEEVLLEGAVLEPGHGP